MGQLMPEEEEGDGQEKGEDKGNDDDKTISEATDQIYENHSFVKPLQSLQIQKRISENSKKICKKEKIVHKSISHPKMNRPKRAATLRHYSGYQSDDSEPSNEGRHLQSKLKKSKLAPSLAKMCSKAESQLEKEKAADLLEH